MFNYLGQLITFLAALVAIKGGTWDESKSGIKKLTVTGFITMVLALIGLITAILITYRTNADLEAHKNMLKVIKAESERGEQMVMSQYIRLDPFHAWQPPNQIYGGSIIKFYEFRSKLLLLYGEDRDELKELKDQLSELGRGVENMLLERIMDERLSESLRYRIILPRKGGPFETVIVGKSGIGMPWAILNLSDRYCDGKVIVVSTPRIRSGDWSWFEEQVYP